MRIAAAIVVAWGLAVTCCAATTHAEFKPVIGAPIRTDVQLTDEQGTRQQLEDFTAGRPTMILFGYHRCPNLCGIAQVSVAEALTATRLPQDAYSVIFASIDPRETIEDARRAHQKLASAVDADVGAWHFVTGDQAAITALETSIGLEPPRILDTVPLIHPVAVSALTQDGRLSRVFFGFDYTSRDLRLALIEASQGHLGTLGERILLYCSGFDPTTGRYTTVIMAVLRAASVFAIAGLASAVFLLSRRSSA